MGVEQDPGRPLVRARAAALTVLVCLGAALGLRYFLNQTIGNALPFVTVFGATAAAQWYGGRRAAIPVALLGLIGTVLMLAPPVSRTRLDEIGGVLGIAAFVFTSALIVGFGEAARAAQIAAHHRSETLRVTLHSIGDAVIMTDTRGVVTSLNAVAESLTGWTSADAIGQPLDVVFRIVTEDTREPVENPATKAIREGTVVGLANHTVLIRRDNVEHAIDDSAAPIRDAQGHVSGCVLVFRDVGAQRQRDRERTGQLLAARLLSSIIDSSEDAIIRKRLDGTIETWNAGAERLFGSQAAEAIGRHISMVIPPERIDEEEQIIATLKAGRRRSFTRRRIRAHAWGTAPHRLNRLLDDRADGCHRRGHGPGGPARVRVPTRRPGNRYLFPRQTLHGGVAEPRCTPPDSSVRVRGQSVASLCQDCATSINYCDLVEVREPNDLPPLTWSRRRSMATAAGWSICRRGIGRRRRAAVQSGRAVLSSAGRRRSAQPA